MAELIRSSAPAALLAKIIFEKKNVKMITAVPVKILVNNKSDKIVTAAPLKFISEYKKVKILAPVENLEVVLLKYLKGGPLAELIHSSAPAAVLAKIIFEKKNVKSDK